MYHVIEIKKAHGGLVAKRVLVKRKNGASHMQTFWVSPSGDKSEIDKIAKERGFRIPPAWTDVHIAEDSNEYKQVTGRDKKNRQVAIYNGKMTAMRDVAKFAKFKEFAREYPKMLEKIQTDMHDDEAAKVMYLISKTGFRVGTGAETHADVKAYGASTLTSEHVSTQGNVVNFNFIGKKGVKINRSIDDVNIASMVKDKKGDLFDTSYSKIRKYLYSITSKDFTPKDFRMHYATTVALQEAKKYLRLDTEKDFKKTQREICKTVASKLGNTPAMAKKAYIVPEVWLAMKHRAKIKEE
jgi:DNA topoisomerase-1